MDLFLIKKSLRLLCLLHINRNDFVRKRYFIEIYEFKLTYTDTIMQSEKREEKLKKNTSSKKIWKLNVLKQIKPFLYTYSTVFNNKRYCQKPEKISNTNRTKIMNTICQRNLHQFSFFYVMKSFQIQFCMKMQNFCLIKRISSKGKNLRHFNVVALGGKLKQR